MSTRVRVILVLIAVMVIGLLVVGVAIMINRRTPPAVEVAEDGKKEPLKPSKFELGEFVAVSRDEDLHYIKVEVVVSYVGNLEAELQERKAELRDAVNTLLMRLTVARAKEDIVDRFLHKEIENRLNQVLRREASESRITGVFIPVFLVN